MQPASRSSLRAAAWLRGWAVLTALASAGCAVPESPVALSTGGGEAWTFEKLVAAQVPVGACDTVVFASPAGSVTVQPDAGQALARVPLGPGTNLVEAECREEGARRGTPARQHWHVRLEDRPKAWVRTVPSDTGIILDAGASELAPVQAAPLVTYEWRARTGNPAPLAGLPSTGRRIELHPPRLDGEYYVTLRVSDAAGRSDESTAVFRVTGGEAEAVDLARDHPAWVDDAVIYGVMPFFFGPRRLDDVTARLDELAALGITTLWLSPITATTPDDFGYAVTDYFRLRADFGSEADLRELIEGAHARNMRVIMDFVPNHVSEKHAYFEDAQARGQVSPYYSFFDRDASGDATHYFDWSNLINLNYDNPEVQRWVIEAFAYWVREFDVDGFRADAVWGPRRRAPEFWARWRAELKRIEPDLLLLAEASARDSYYFENGFDAAYDWTGVLGEWAWRDAFERPAQTARRLRAAIAASQAQPEPDALIFRFLNNNDTGRRFITRYGIPRTRVGAAMLLTLPGLPQIHTGQEVGAAFEPYDEGPPVIWTDTHELRPWYARLISLRAAHTALRSNEIRLLDIAPADKLLAYIRPGAAPRQSVLVLLNWSAAPLDIVLPDSALEALDASTGLVDLISSERLRPHASAVSLPAYGVRILTAG